MTDITRLILTVMLLACVTCRADPATSPTNKAVVICFNGKLDSRSSCSVTCFQPDGTLHPAGKMTCGLPGKVSEVEWRFLQRKGNVDVYEFSRRFPADKAESKTDSQTVGFRGARVIAFEDSFQVIVIQSPRAKDGAEPSVGGAGEPAPQP